MAKPENHTGKKFNLLTATKKLGAYYRCTCDCGGHAFVRSDHLSSGHTKSCGCLKQKLVEAKQQRIAEAQALRVSAKAQQDKHKPKLRAVWQQMIYRCTQPTCPEYESYGAIGITVCNEWLTSFDAFYSDVRPKYTPGKSLDRRNNDLGYFPGNCRWATPKMQARNRRNTLYLWSELAGKKTTLPAFAEKHSIPYIRAYTAYKKLVTVESIPWADDLKIALGIETVRSDTWPFKRIKS